MPVVTPGTCTPPLGGWHHLIIILTFIFYPLYMHITCFNYKKSNKKNKKIMHALYCFRASQTNIQTFMIAFTKCTVCRELNITLPVM